MPPSSCSLLFSPHHWGAFLCISILQAHWAASLFKIPLIFFRTRYTAVSWCHTSAFRKPHSFHLVLLSTVLSLTVSTILSILPGREGNYHGHPLSCKNLPRAVVLWVHCFPEWASNNPRAVVFGVQFPLVWACVHSFDSLQFSTRGHLLGILGYFICLGLMKGAGTSNESNWDEVKMMWQSEGGQISEWDKTDSNASFATS